MDSTVILNKLIADGLVLIDEKYGPNSGYYQAYHNAEHADDVMDAAQIIASEAAIQEKIPTNYIPLLVLAACYHDAVHDRSDGQNEAESAQLIATKMRDSGVFTEDIIGLVAEAIMATRFRLDDGHIRQAVTNEYSTQILADADLATAGRPFTIYWDRALKLRQETGNTQTETEFITTQLTYLQNHQFHTPEASEHFPHKATNIAALQALLDRTA